MDIQFSARHFNASAGLQDRIQEEMDKLAKFYPNITSASVILTKLNTSVIAKFLSTSQVPSLSLLLTKRTWARLLT